MSENEEDIQGYCDFCGEKIKEDDSSYGDNEGHIFCDYPCLERFKMEIKIHALIAIRKYMEVL